jgi:cobyrinic acid a,c-diamide synthase
MENSKSNHPLKLPRLLLAGTGGDCGKTYMAIGLAAALRAQGLPVAPFKKGPDYIDAGWLTIACGVAARNLDTWMMGPETVLRTFTEKAIPNGFNLIEGNRGLHDGEDGAGTHSSAELAKLLKAPVLLIIPTVKVTRTAAAVALGMQKLDLKVEIAGVILNRVATSRQEAVIRAAIESSTGLPVLGAVPRITEGALSSRHLGLITPEEHAHSREVIDLAAKIITQNVDLHKVRTIAESAAPLMPWDQAPTPGRNAGGKLKIGYFKSSAFTFYYPENLEAIKNADAVLVAVDPLQEQVLPDLDALYIGGGFPETHAARLAANAAFQASVAQAAQSGLPIWAECGGLIFLCRSVYWEGNRYPMAGVFPADIILDRLPAGHGYEEVLVDQPNPFIRTGVRLRGHEFHYSKLQTTASLNTMLQVTRGTGLGNGRDGLILHRTVATYLHLHALAAPEWVSGLLAAARDYSAPGDSAPA